MRLLPCVAILAVGLCSAAQAQITPAPSAAPAKPPAAASRPLGTSKRSLTAEQAQELHHALLKLNEALVPCDVVAALKATNVAIDRITKALGE